MLRAVPVASRPAARPARRLVSCRLSVSVSAFIGSIRLYYRPALTAPVSSSPLSLRIVLGAGALLAAAITGALGLRRTLQRRRRKPGEKIAIVSEASAAEVQLAAAAEPAGAARLDVALRTLAHHAAQQRKDPVLPPPQNSRDWSFMRITVRASFSCTCCRNGITIR
ncbi:hypothetical protein [Streptomyces sp. NPDC052721]|uniref:hypothetical protein n=1 Tax=Streptomyces sp. NPDC052721 TaxID=3154955 RepID=UPI003425FEFB